MQTSMSSAPPAQPPAAAAVQPSALELATASAPLGPTFGVLPFSSIKTFDAELEAKLYATPPLVPSVRARYHPRLIHSPPSCLRSNLLNLHRFALLSAAGDAHLQWAAAPLSARLAAPSPLLQWVYELAWASALLAGFWAPAAALLSKLFQPPRAAVAHGNCGNTTKTRCGLW